MQAEYHPTIASIVSDGLEIAWGVENNSITNVNVASSDIYDEHAVSQGMGTGIISKSDSPYDIEYINGSNTGTGTGTGTGYTCTKDGEYCTCPIILGTENNKLYPILSTIPTGCTIAESCNSPSDDIIGFYAGRNKTQDTDLFTIAVLIAGDPNNVNNNVYKFTYTPCSSDPTIDMYVDLTTSHVSCGDQPPSGAGVEDKTCINISNNLSQGSTSLYFQVLGEGLYLCGISYNYSLMLAKIGAFSCVSYNNGSPMDSTNADGSSASKNSLIKYFITY